LDWPEKLARERHVFTLQRSTIVVALNRELKLSFAACAGPRNFGVWNDPEKI
jgi:hypothetical protein